LSSRQLEIRIGVVNEGKRSRDAAKDGDGTLRDFDADIIAPL